MSYASLPGGIIATLNDPFRNVASLRLDQPPWIPPQFFPMSTQLHEQPTSAHASSEKHRPPAQIRGPHGLMHAVFFVHSMFNYAEANRELFRRYGDVVFVRRPNNFLFFFRPSHVKHILRTNVLNYPKSYQYDMLKPLLGDGIFVSEGDVWTRQRRLLAPEFRENTVSRFVPPMVECADRLFAEWDEAQHRRPIDVTADMMRLTLWIIGRAMFKSEFLQDAELIGHSLEVCLAHATLQMVLMGLYKDWLPTRGNREAREAEKALNDAITRIIRRAREGDLGTLDVLSRMIQARDPETGATMSDKQLLDETKSLVLAGHETTSLALSWAFYLLSTHPEIEERLVEEATRVLGDRQPTAQDIQQLVYTRQVFLEVMRLYPPVPGVSRDTLKADVIEGIPVPAKQLVVVSPYVTHRHPDYWTDPERFDPDRFSEKRAEQIEPYSYMPFLLGRRQCLGEHFAMLEGPLLLAMIVRRYAFKRVSHEPIGTRPISTLRLARPLMVHVHERNATKR
jgi:cytochrome P450